MEEVFVPWVDAVVEALKVRDPWVGDIGCDKDEWFEVTADDSALLVVDTLLAEIEFNLLGYATGKVLTDQYGSAGVSLLFGQFAAIPEL